MTLSCWVTDAGLPPPATQSIPNQPKDHECDVGGHRSAQSSIGHGANSRHGATFYFLPGPILIPAPGPANARRQSQQSHQEQTSAGVPVNAQPGQEAP